MTSDDEILALARDALHAGEFEQAYGILESAIKLGNASNKIRQEYGFLLWTGFEFDRAEAQFGELLADSDTPTLTMQRIAKSYFAIGRFAKAAEVMEAVVATSPLNLCECLEQWASCEERTGNQARASELAQRALEARPGSARAVRLLAHIDKRNGDFQQAIDRLSCHLQQGSGDWDWGLRYELAASLDRVGEYDRAWQELVKAKQQLKPQTLPALRQSYQIRNRQGELAKRVTDADLNYWRRASDAAQSEINVAVLAGFPRSGTTLLEQILTAHDDCVGTDETGILTSQFISPIVWQAEDAFAALLELRSLDRSQLETGRAVYRKFTEGVIGEAIGDRLLIEKDPLLTADLPVVLRLFPNSPMIIPLRDPRDVIISYFFTMVPINWNSAPATDIVEAARFYHDVMRHWVLFRDRIQSPTIETRYEDLVNDQVTEAKRLTDFLGMKWDDSILDVSKRSGQKAVSTPTYDDITKPIYTSSLRRWENYQKHIEPALGILKPYAKEFGYE